MRKFIVLSMITLDGVMQGPGSPDEDTSGGFRYGGWVAPYDDDVGNAVMATLLQPADLLLGRTTFEIWEAYWPVHADSWPGINAVTKYVFSATHLLEKIPMYDIYRTYWGTLVLKPPRGICMWQKKSW